MSEINSSSESQVPGTPEGLAEIFGQAYADLLSDLDRRKRQTENIIAVLARQRGESGDDVKDHDPVISFYLGQIEAQQRTLSHFGGAIAVAEAEEALAKEND